MGRTWYPCAPKGYERDIFDGRYIVHLRDCDKWSFSFQDNPDEILVQRSVFRIRLSKDEFLKQFVPHKFRTYFYGINRNNNECINGTNEIIFSKGEQK